MALETTNMLHVRYCLVKPFTQNEFKLSLGMQSNRLNLDGLTPDQRKVITELSKKIQLLESKLAVLQAAMVRIDPKLMANLARNFKHLNLN